MLKNGFLAAVLLLALTTTAMADGFYGALDIGRSTNKDSCAGVPAGISCSDAGSAYRIGGGYQITRIWGVEVDYGVLASTKASLGSLSSELKPKSLQVVATGTFSIANQFSVIGRLGIARNSTDYTSSNGLTADSTTSTNLAYGIGAQYDFSKNMGVRAQYESVGKITDPTDTSLTYKVSMISAGLVFKF